MIGQQWVSGVQRDKEGVVSIGGRHNVGSGVLAEGAKGRGVGPNIRRHSCNCCGGAVEGWAHMSRASHGRFNHSAFMRGTGGFL